METNNTKGAIEFCKDLKEVGFKYGGIEYDLNPHIDNIIELLQRGEKYEKIWGEFKKKYSIDWNLIELGYLDIDYATQKDLNIIMEELQQKYFPKPSKDFTKKVMKKIKGK